MGRLESLPYKLFSQLLIMYSCIHEGRPDVPACDFHTTIT